MKYNEKQLTGKFFFSFSFYLYRFRKYLSCGFPILNFCNPGVRYETPCVLLTLLRPGLTSDLVPSRLLSKPLQVFMFLYDPQNVTFSTVFICLYSGPLKVGWSPGKKHFGPPIKDGPSKILHTSFVLMSKKHLVRCALTVSCTVIWAWSKTILRRKTKTYET